MWCILLIHFATVVVTWLILIEWKDVFQRFDTSDTTPLLLEQSSSFLVGGVKTTEARKAACSLTAAVCRYLSALWFIKGFFFPSLLILNPRGREYYPLHRALNGVKHEMRYDSGSQLKKSKSFTRHLRCWRVKEKNAAAAAALLAFRAPTAPKRLSPILEIRIRNSTKSDWAPHKCSRCVCAS